MVENHIITRHLRKYLGDLVADPEARDANGNEIVVMVPRSELAARRLGEILLCGSDRDALKAAEIVLDRTEGATPKTIEHKGEKIVRAYILPPGHGDNTGMLSAQIQDALPEPEPERVLVNGRDGDGEADED